MATTETTNKYLNLQHTSAAKVARMLNMSEEQLLDALRKLDPEFMFTAVSNALHKFSDRMDNLEPETLELLNAIADFSPDCREQMGDLYKADAAEIFQDPVKVQQLKDLFTKLKNTESLQQMHIDLTNAMESVAQEIIEDQQLYTQRLKESLQHSPQMQEAIKEHEHLTAKAISSKRDNAMFDPLRVIGHLLAVLIHMRFIVPMETKLYPLGFKHNDSEKDEFLDFNRKRFADSDVLPGAGPAPQGGALPPGLKF
jgi:hypothetical protein